MNDNKFVNVLRSIWWMIALTVLLVVWAIANIIPVHDTPFDEYVRNAVVDDKREDLNALLERAERQVDAGESVTVFMALKNIANEERIDLLNFFPHIRVMDVRNLEKRNNLLMQQLLQRSHSKVKLGLDLKGGAAFTFAVNEEDLEDNDGFRQLQLEKAKEIISTRVDGLGVAEPVIRLKGENRIEVQMPGMSLKENPEAVDRLKAPAKLEFSLVHRTMNPETSQEPPLGYVRMVQDIEDRRTGEITQIPYYIKRRPAMEGDAIEEAWAQQGDFGSYQIHMRFNNEGAKKFAEITENIAEENTQGNIGKLAIILDGKLYSTPRVENAIYGGGAMITGSFTAREAHELANVLSNPLKVGLHIEEMYEVGPSLAKDARSASIKAGIIGASLVIIFMLVYYLFAGLVATTAVLVNILLVVGTLSSFDATLTLPGVAALVLTVGMAVDANILIFERIREELNLGKSLSSSLQAGFDKALSTIVDANVTTLITALILLWLGTGPVKGFGLTLAIGIISTMFCALIVTRWLLDLLVHSGIVTSLMKFQLFKKMDIQFLDYRNKAFAISWSIVAVGVVSFFFHFDNLFGIDFTGGDEVTVTYENRVSAQEIEKVAQEAKFIRPDGEVESFGEVNPIYQTQIGAEQQQIIKIQTESGKGKAYFDALTEAYPDAGLVLTGETHIGAAVGNQVKWSAIYSIAAALIGILFYIAVRFEIGYGIGAVVATIHDMLMTIGMFVFLGEFLGIGSGQFTAPMIAAILMTVGYSINDTIVVFDRVREELELNPGVPLNKIINMATNRVFSRTILTSVTTLLATFALFLFGAGIIIDFSLVFLLGILTGTFSSIFIASPVFFWYHKGDRRKVEERHILPTYEWSSTGSSAKAKS